jgi:hypothetical protein
MCSCLPVRCTVSAGREGVQSSGAAKTLPQQRVCKNTVLSFPHQSYKSNHAGLTDMHPHIDEVRYTAVPNTQHTSECRRLNAQQPAGQGIGGTNRARLGSHVSAPELTYTVPFQVTTSTFCRHAARCHVCKGGCHQLLETHISRCATPATCSPGEKGSPSAAKHPCHRSPCSRIANTSHKRATVQLACALPPSHLPHAHTCNNC